jgi:hypothetical protein
MSLKKPAAAVRPIDPIAPLRPKKPIKPLAKPVAAKCGRAYWSFHNLGDVTAFKKGPN